MYSNLGINLRPANTDRINGWAEILKRLGDASATPTLFILRRCTRLIETLPCLQHDPARPEDVLKVDPDDDGVGGDAADTLRNLIATKSRQAWSTKLRGLCCQIPKISILVPFGSFKFPHPGLRHPFNRKSSEYLQERT